MRFGGSDALGGCINDLFLPKNAFFFNFGGHFGNFWVSGVKNIDGGHIRDPYIFIICKKKMKKKMAIF